MLALTIEALRKNPWNVMTHTLPTRCPPLLLELACLAADYCRKSEYLLMNAARGGRHVPSGWQPGPQSPDVHEINEARGWDAERKLDEIRERYERECGVKLEL